MPLVLVIDDDPSILDNLEFNLKLHGYDVLKAPDGYSGIDIFKCRAPEIDAVVTDMKMPGLSGLDVIKNILEIDPDIGIIVFTGHGDTENAVAAMREGAVNYIQKPFKMDNLLLSIENAMEKRKMLKENKILQKNRLEKTRYLQELHDSAQRILINYISKKLPEFDMFDTACIYRNYEKVGGDMYDVYETERHLYFYIFDVASHGILAAVNTLIIKAHFCAFKYHPSNENSIKTVFNDVNLELCKNTSSSVFATAFAGCIDKQSKRLYYISAGHIDQYIIRNDCLIALPSTGALLGSFENVSYDIKSHQLERGDKILLFTDGITEVRCNDSVIGTECIKKIIEKNKEKPVKQLVDSVYEEALTLSDGSFDDDTTILGLQVTK
ncbi:MAG: SpoIIE family protein phosphatase [Clostridiaceae bacterium]|nr:SpoIIE family protein phosphatase [Clostridiaceae bacterium]